jgi:hypothetical protein
MEEEIWVGDPGFISLKIRHRAIEGHTLSPKPHIRARSGCCPTLSAKAYPFHDLDTGHGFVSVAPLLDCVAGEVGCDSRAAGGAADC